MANIRLSLFLAIILMIAACDNNDEPNPVNENPTTKELLSGKWLFTSVYMEGQSAAFVDSTMEFTPARAERFRLKYRYFIYDEKGYYRVDYVRNGYYKLGRFDQPNWQPDIGTYVIKGDSIIHNPGMPYRAAYFISRLGIDGRFTRLSDRYMSAPGKIKFWDGQKVDSVYWDEKDTIKYREEFYKVED